MNVDSISYEDLERIAEQIHITWMNNRIKEGWVYGPTRNDENKTTPCLVSYNELPENEKDYDRNTAKTTIDALYTLGYSIVMKGKNNE